MRPDHAANDGKEFSWDDPPATGHPGEGYNCRCWPQPSRKDGNMEFSHPELLILAAVIVATRRIEVGAAIGVAKAISKIFKNPISRRPKGVPKEWRKRSTRKDDGVIYEKPGTKGTTHVRVMKAKRDSRNPGQRQNYVVWQRGGKSLDKNGNIVHKQSKDSHIPLDEFRFDSEKIK